MALQNVLGNLALDLSLTSGGQKSQIWDAQSRQSAEVNRFGHLVTAPYQELAAFTFADGTSTLDLLVINRTHSGTGTTVVGNGMVAISSGVTVNTTEAIQGIQAAPFNAVAPNRYVSGIRLVHGGTAGNTRMWGAFDTTQANGHFFRQKNTTFEVGSRKSGVETTIANGSFNGTMGVSFDPGTVAYTYFIEYAGGGASFYVAVAGQGIQLLHSMVPAVNTTTVIDSLLLSARIENTNTTNTTNVSIEGRGQGIGRVGVLNADQLVQSLTDTTYAAPVKAVMVGRVGANQFIDIAATTTGSLSLDLTALSGGFTSTNTSVGISAVQIASAPLTGRKTISLKASCSSAGRIIAINSSNAVNFTTLNIGNYYQLTDRETIDLDLGPGVSVWAVSNNGTGCSLMAIEIA